MKWNLVMYISFNYSHPICMPDMISMLSFLMHGSFWSIVGEITSNYLRSNHCWALPGQSHPQRAAMFWDSWIRPSFLIFFRTVPSLPNSHLPLHLHFNLPQSLPESTVIPEALNIHTNLSSSSFPVHNTRAWPCSPFYIPPLMTQTFNQIFPNLHFQMNRDLILEDLGGRRGGSIYPSLLWC